MFSLVLWGTLCEIVRKYSLLVPFPHSQMTRYLEASGIPADRRSWPGASSIERECGARGIPCLRPRKFGPGLEFVDVSGIWSRARQLISKLNGIAIQTRYRHHALTAELHVKHLIYPRSITWSKLDASLRSLLPVDGSDAMTSNG